MVGQHHDCLGFYTEEVRGQPLKDDFGALRGKDAVPLVSDLGEPPLLYLFPEDFVTIQMLQIPVIVFNRRAGQKQIALIRSQFSLQPIKDQA